MKYLIFSLLLMIAASPTFAGESCQCGIVKYNNTTRDGGSNSGKVECMNIDKGFMSVSGYISSDQESWLKSNSKVTTEGGIKSYTLDCKLATKMHTAFSGEEIEAHPDLYKAPTAGRAGNKSQTDVAKPETKSKNMECNCESVTETEAVCQGRHYSRRSDSSVPSSRGQTGAQ